MYVAFRRVRRKSRIPADFADDADYGICEVRKPRLSRKDQIARIFIAIGRLILDSIFL